MPLTGEQREALRLALESAFDPFTLPMMLQEKLDKKLWLIAPPAAPFNYQVFSLIGAAEMEGWTNRLVLALRETRPERPDLVLLAHQLGIAPTGTPKQPELEAMIIATNALIDPVQWRVNMAAVEERVCRIKIKGLPAGTGFLVGKEAVITNWHVVKPVKEGTSGYTPADVTLQFGYKRLENGEDLSPGVEYILVKTADWLLDFSPYSKIDLESDPKSDLPDPGELDYALLRVDGAPGAAKLGAKPSTDPNAAPRGWIAAPSVPYPFQPDTPLMIMEHPKGAPLKYQQANNGVESVNANNTRVRHRLTTDKGSSGSPMFDQKWNLVALHHSGDPDSILPTYNEAIPFTLIVDRIKNQGVGNYLG